MSHLVENFDSDADSFSKNYLRTYYSSPSPDADEQLVIKFCVEQYPRLAGAAILLDIGCGPTVHHVLLAEPHVPELHLADYLPDCLEEIRLWKNNDPAAHNWYVFTRFTLQAEGVEPTSANVATREQRTKNKITSLLHCDLRQPHPLGKPIQYPAVTCFYTTEQASMVGDDWTVDRRRDAWRGVMNNLATLVRGGGTLFMACVRNSDHYITYDFQTGEPHRHPLPVLTENDFAQALHDLDFDLAKSEIRGIEFTGQEAEGVPGIILLAARRR